MNDAVEDLVSGLDDKQRRSLGDLSTVVAYLENCPAPEASVQEQARLLSALLPYLEETAPKNPEEGMPAGQYAPQPAFSLRGWLRLAWSQAVLLEKPFWWSNGLVMLLGLALAALRTDSLLVVVFAFLAPILAAAGVAYAFRPATRSLWELEKISPTGTLELLYARLALVIGFNLALSLALLGVVWFQAPNILLWRLLAAWLGPMLALAGLALYTTLRWGPAAGAILPLGLWGGLTFLGWRQAIERSAESGLADPAEWLAVQVGHSEPLLLFYLAACLLGLALLYQAGRLALKGTALWD